MVRRWRGVLWACALAVLGQAAGAHAQAAPQPASAPERGIILQLADGSIVHIPCDKARTSCPIASAPENAWISGSARRAPLKRGSRLFDARNPGVVASIRG